MLITSDVIFRFILWMFLLFLLGIVGYRTKRDLGILVVVVVIIGGLLVLSQAGEHFLRQKAQQNERLHEVVLVLDACSFMTCGGDPIGYNNYFKWAYAKWRNDPARTWLEKVMFWNEGIGWTAKNPPNQYPYPPLYSTQ